MDIKYLFTLLLVISCGQEVKQVSEISIDTELRNELSRYGGVKNFVLADKIEDFPNDPQNSLSKEKILLGKLLFHETGLALIPKDSNNTGTYSCASCHRSDAGFSSGNLQGVGEGGQGDLASRLSFLGSDTQNLKSPTILNIAYQENVLWNGKLGSKKSNLNTEFLWSDEGSATNSLGFSGVETQAIVGLKVHRLIDSNTDLETTFLKTNSTYNKLFEKIYDSNVNLTNIALSIAAYERSVTASRSPFQDYLKGDLNALSLRQKKGLKLFLGKAKCVSCHSGAALSDGLFHKIGFNDYPEEIIQGDFIEKKGRGSFSLESSDDYKMKTPQLYNLKDQHSFGHGGSFLTLRSLLEYKNSAISQNENVIFLDIYPLNLSVLEMDQLEDFLMNSLYDDNLSRHAPSFIPTNKNFPNN